MNTRAVTLPSFYLRHRNVAVLPMIVFALTGCMDEKEAEDLNVATARFSSEPVRGDMFCDYGALDCNTCVNDVRGAFNGISSNATAQIRYKSRGDSTLPPFSRKLSNFGDNDSHVQSIVRLSGVGADLDPNGKGPWFALSRANPGSVGGSGIFTVQLADFATNGGFALEASARGEPTQERATKAYYPVEGLDHAGGMQAVGKFVVSASNCDTASACGSNGYVHTWNFSDPTSGSAWVSAMRIGEQGEPGNIGTVTSAAITKLASSQYLLWVQGKDTAHEGWFYVGDGSSLGSINTWRYVGYTSIPQGGVNEFQNTQLVTECGSGDIYMIGSGNGDYDGSADDVLQTAFNVTPGHNNMSLLKLDPSERSFASLSLVSARQFNPGDGEYCTFRAGASVHVTPDHRLAAYCTTRKSNEDWRGNPDSKLKMEEYAPR